MKIEAKLPKASGTSFKAAFLPYLERAAFEVSRAMRQRLVQNKSVAFSNLLNSVQVYRDGELSRTVAPAQAHGLMVDQGTGPAAGMARYFPNVTHLMAYVKLRGGIRFSGKQGSERRRKQQDDVRARAWALARFIYWHGTKPHPFVEPTAEEMRPRVEELLTQGAVAGVTAKLGGAS